MSRTFSRRRILQGGSVFAAGSALSSLAVPGSSAETPPLTAPLQFGQDGKFKIVQFNDTQDDHLTDKRTIEFMGLVLDQEKPNFALINGDVITDGPKISEQVYQAINNVVLPMESRGIPWAITFGNHDEDSMEKDNTGVDETKMASFVRQYRHNLNPEGLGREFGHCDEQLLVKSSRNADQAAFAIWLMDSGNYLPGGFSDQKHDDVPDYDYIRPPQIEWYVAKSRATEERYGKKIPGLMYFHIPTYEHRDMWFGGPANHEDAKHNEAAKNHHIDGVKNEDVYYGSFNSGIYGAVRDRGDVLGIYCGHDHINSFHGNYFGVELGYCPGTGFAPYGLHDGTWEQNTLRGARVFELNENSEKVYESTHVIFAKDLGVDMNPEKFPLKEPVALPEYIKLPQS